MISMILAVGAYSLPFRSPLAISIAEGGTPSSFTVVVGRHGGPEFLSSELARLGHMVALAASVQTD